MQAPSLIRLLLPTAVLSITLGCGGGASSNITTPASAPVVTNDTATAKTAEQRACIEQANPGADFPAKAPTRIGVQHLVVKHADVERVDASITRDRGEACLRAVEALNKMKSGEAFSSLVAAYSDEAGAATRDGSLGDVTKDDVVPPFAAAAFALEIGQVSYVVETKFGFHIIVRVN